MKITILLKNGPGTAEAERALQTASDMLSKGHSVQLYLLQDAVNFCRPNQKHTSFMEMNRLIDEKLGVNVLIQDAELRGLDLKSVKRTISNGDYESLIDLVESSDRVIGML
jgi:sulfur relay protein TusB/DsrH